MKLITSELKKLIGKRVKITKIDSRMHAFYTVEDVYKRHLILDTDTLSFGQISEIELAENKP